MSTLGARIAGRARRFGPLAWSAFMEAALYDEEGGFYQTGGRAGRAGDFVTSPEIGPLFAAVVARALDRWWDEQGRPDPFVVVEAAAGAGTLARDILAAGPDCGPALRYVLVERSPRLREAERRLLPLESPALVLGPSAPGGVDSDDEAVHHLPGRGPMLTSLGELPSVDLPGVVLANELLDNLPFDLLEYRGGRWQEVLVGAADGGEELVEVLVPAPPEVAAEADRLVAGSPGGADGGRTPAPERAGGTSPTTRAGGVAEGARVPLQRAAAAWLRQALGVLQEGRVVVVDYAGTTAGLAGRPWSQWLRTYRRHQPGGPPLDRPGSQDITCVVATDQLAEVRRPAGDMAQAQWLRSQGLDELVEGARAVWRERAGLGDLEAMKARSRVGEADALTDEAGLGAFRVLQWDAG